MLLGYNQLTLQEDAFWSLVAVVEHIQPSDYYTNKSMAACQADQRVLRGLSCSAAPL